MVLCAEGWRLRLAPRCCSGFVRALEDAVKVVDDVSFPIDTNDRQQMLNIVNSCIGTKFTMRFGSLIAVRTTPLCTTPTAGPGGAPARHSCCGAECACTAGVRTCVPKAQQAGCHSPACHAEQIESLPACPSCAATMETGGLGGTCATSCNGPARACLAHCLAAGACARRGAGHHCGPWRGPARDRHQVRGRVGCALGRPAPPTCHAAGWHLLWHALQPGEPRHRQSAAVESPASACVPCPASAAALASPRAVARLVSGHAVLLR